MQDVREQRIYCAEQIYVPEDLPVVMKNYTKAVIRAQPSDLVQFSLEYFQKEAAKLKDMDKREEGTIHQKPSENLIKIESGN